MEEWAQKYVDSRQSEINELAKEKKEILKKLKEILDDSQRYSLYWRLKEIFEQLWHKYRIIERWSRTGYQLEIKQNLCREIYYFEKCLEMLRIKHGVKYVEFGHYLNAARLEYEYFIEKRYGNIPDKFQQDDFAHKLGGETQNPKINLIGNNIKNAQANLRYIINKRREYEKDQFIYYEVLADLYIHLYLIWQEPHDINPLILKEKLQQAYFFYLISLKYKEFVERANPRTGFDGLHGWPCLGIFVDFFTEIGVVNIHDVRLKINALERRYIEQDDINKLKGQVKEIFQ